jgi:hypothetical protein
MLTLPGAVHCGKKEKRDYSLRGFLVVRWVRAAVHRNGGDKLPHPKDSSGGGPADWCASAEEILSKLNYYFGILEPSVAQPPLPLQLFLPLQPLSLLLQPPLPLQEFWPLQACFSGFLLWSGLSWLAAENEDVALLWNTVDAWTVAPVPASRPATAAPVMRALVVLVMGEFSLHLKFAHRTGTSLEKPEWNPGREGRRSSGSTRSPSRLANPSDRKAIAPV